MSPEYATEGIFSLKYDVYSFGVLLIEIISGKRNKGFCHLDPHHNLIGHVSRTDTCFTHLLLLSFFLSSTHFPRFNKRCIQVGLLCVQKFPENRPYMSSVVFMLANEDVALPRPREPGFFTERGLSTGTSPVKPHSNNIYIFPLVLFIRRDFSVKF
ncbi:hypothetical protein Patl1_24123 [Pistacia atlantica]|uniref:Uncharacterized protein n=1 Tax=Pistacia atlantica TaxID=434234 RepID=A0ACC0ZV12_9ROSI|nr:hypothetical protein Patl1_24123 [Pistacia atlantica]